MKIFLLLLMLIGTRIACAVDIDFSKLREAEGDDFKTELERLARDVSTVQALRTPSLNLSVRDELIRGLVLAQVDNPEIFKNFQATIDLAREDSPIWKDRLSLIDAASRPNFNYSSGRESLIRYFMQEWIYSSPAPEILFEKYKNPGARPTQRGDGAARPERVWPALAFGVSSVEKELRHTVWLILLAWCRESLYSENSLESLLWLCERTDYDFDVRVAYSSMVRVAIGSQIPDLEKSRLVTRSLSDLLLGEKIKDAKDTISINFRIDSAEKYGNSTHVPLLRCLADTPLWSAYRDRMLQVAEALEKGKNTAEGK